jgi:uncharacterized membrane protein
MDIWFQQTFVLMCHYLNRKKIANINHNFKKWKNKNAKQEYDIFFSSDISHCLAFWTWIDILMR